MQKNNNLTEQYNLRFTDIENYRTKVWEVLVRHYFQQYIPLDSTILDLGSGWGEFINNIKGKRRIGIDLNEDAKHHLESSVEFINQDCSEEWDLPDNSLDVIFTSNFLEHLLSKSHIEKTIIQISRCLKSNGRLICLGPNVRYLPGAYWDFWDHHVAITDASLCEILELNHFNVELSKAKFLPYTMANKRPPPLFLLRLYLALPLAWNVFGKQFLIIARNNKVD